MKKNFIKCFIFVLLCLLVISGLQVILSYKWERKDHIESKYKDYINDASMVENGVDILYLGSSKTYADIAPAVVWNEIGVTGYNFGISMAISPLEYFMLEYLLEFNTPKLIVLEISRVTTERDLDKYGSSQETAYRRIIDTMPDFKTKQKMINWLKETYTSQNGWDYYFPFLRYHSRWEELKVYDFIVSRNYKLFRNYFKGALYNTEQTPQTWDTYSTIDSDSESVELYIEYYQKIIDLCKDKNIDVLLSIVPCTKIYTSNYLEAKELADKNDLKLLFMLSEEEINEIGLNKEFDLYDTWHMNILGQRKYSIFLSKYLKANFNLTDHRSDERYNNWNQFYEDYETIYKKALEKMKHD